MDKLGSSLAGLIDLITKLTGKVIDVVPAQFPLVVAVYGARLKAQTIMASALLIFGFVVLALGFLHYFKVFLHNKKYDNDYDIPGILIAACITGGIAVFSAIIWLYSVIPDVMAFSASPAAWTIMHLIGK